VFLIVCVIIYSSITSRLPLLISSAQNVYVLRYIWVSWQTFWWGCYPNKMSTQVPGSALLFQIKMHLAISNNSLCI